MIGPKTVARGAAVTVGSAALLGSLTLVSAGPAPAESLAKGSYSVSTSPSSQWTVRSVDCTPKCSAWVASSDGWQGYAALSGRTWTLSVYRGTWPRSSYPVDPRLCPAQGRPDLLISEIFTFDEASLGGNVERVRGNQCGGPSTRESEPITLTRLD